MEHRDDEPLPRRWWPWVVGVLVLGLAGAYVLLSPAPYQATSTVFLATADSAEDSAQARYNNAQFIQARIRSYVGVVTTDDVLVPVIEELDLPMTPTELADAIDVEVPTGTVIMEITVSDGSAERAAAIANAIPESLEVAINDLEQRTSPTPTLAVAATVMQRATVPTSPARSWVPLAAVAALVIGALGAWTALQSASRPTLYQV